jgi:hypothetical protein
LIFLNRTDSDIDLFESFTRDDFRIEATTKDGIEVPLTAYGRFMKENPPGGSAGTITVKPGQTAAWTLCLSQEFDLTIPGEYLFRIQRLRASVAKKDIVIESSIKIKVAERNLADSASPEVKKTDDIAKKLAAEFRKKK